MPTRLGAIDAGSNAIRVVIAELGATELVRIEAERIPVRLGHNAFTHGVLEPQTIDDAVAAFVHFRERFDHHQVAIYRAVATSAVRNASNRDVLLHRLYHEAGIELEVIEGEEEARLVRKAVSQAMGGPAPRVILDLGGGSLEVNVRAGSAWRGHSLPVGTVRLLETFGLDGAIGDAEAGMVRRYTATLVTPIARAANGHTTAAITGGNADALAKIFGEQGFDLAALGIPSEEEYVAAYCKRTGRDAIDHWEFYLVFNMFRIAAILHGVLARALQGNAASQNAREQGSRARLVADVAWDMAQQMGD